MVVPRLAIGVMSEPTEKTLIVTLSEVVDEWEKAFEDRQRAERQYRRAVRSAEARLHKARGGLTPNRWHRARTGRAGISSVFDSQALNRALRHNADVLRAEAELRDVASVSAARVRTADRALAGATRKLLVYGPIVERITEIALDDLRHLAGDGSSARERT